MEDKRFIIAGQSRGKIAAALVEYRAYVRRYGDDCIAGVIADMHTALHQQREVNRAIGLRR